MTSRITWPIFKLPTLVLIHNSLATQNPSIIYKQLLSCLSVLSGTPPEVKKEHNNVFIYQSTYQGLILHFHISFCVAVFLVVSLRANRVAVKRGALGAALRHTPVGNII